MLNLNTIPPRTAYPARTTSAVRFQSRIVHNTLPQMPPREKCIAIYGGNSVAPVIITEAERWATVFGENGFHAVTGGGQGVMEAARKGIKAGSGHALGAGMEEWQEEAKPTDYDAFSFHDTVTERFEGTGGFYDRAGCQLMFPGNFGSRSEAYRIVYDLLAGVTSHSIQQRLVVADLDPAFSDWVRSQFNAASYNADQFVSFVKTPEDALAIFRDEAVPKTRGVRQEWIA